MGESAQSVALETGQCVIAEKAGRASVESVVTPVLEHRMYSEHDEDVINMEDVSRTDKDVDGIPRVEESAPTGVLLNQQPASAPTVDEFARMMALEEPPLLGTPQNTAKVTLWHLASASTPEMVKCWITGTGEATLLFDFNPHCIQYFEKRRWGLEQAKEQSVVASKCKLEAKYKEFPPLVPPPQPPMPDLWCLRTIESDVGLPWKWDFFIVEDFRRAWEESYTSDVFQLKLQECVFWWTFKKNDKNLREDLKAQRDSITNALETLVYSKCFGESYVELDAVCAYLKWSMDYARFEDDKRKHRDTLEAEKISALERARLAFRQKNGRLLERCVWEWCPLYQVLVGAIPFHALPRMPWTHNNSESETVRLRIIHTRAKRLTPPPLILVFRIDWDNSYEPHRRVTCPDYGLTAKVIVTEVQRRSWSLRKALHDLLQRGDRMFADFSCDDRDTLFDTVQAQIDRIKEGNGEDIVKSIMDWVHRV